MESLLCSAWQRHRRMSGCSGQRTRTLRPAGKTGWSNSSSASFPTIRSASGEATQFDAELNQPLSLDEVQSTASPSACAQVPEDQLPPPPCTPGSSPASRQRRPKRATRSMRSSHARLCRQRCGEGQLLLPGGRALARNGTQGPSGANVFATGRTPLCLETSVRHAGRNLLTTTARRDLAIFGQLSAAESMPGENVTINSEGEAQAGPSPTDCSRLLRSPFCSRGRRATTAAMRHRCHLGWRLRARRSRREPGCTQCECDVGLCLLRIGEIRG